MSTTSCVHLGCPHATGPTVCWRVYFLEQRSNGDWCDGDQAAFGGSCYVWVPPRDVWMPDTVRMVLYELAAYLPAHEPKDAQCVVTARRPRVPRGRRPKARAPRRPRRLDFDTLEIGVQACGWRAEVYTWLHHGQVKAGELRPLLGSWSEPMQAFFASLIACSPFPLAPIREVLSASGPEFKLKPSRHCVQRGIDPAYIDDQKAYDDDDFNRRIRKIVDKLRDSLDDDDDEDD